MLVFAVVSLSGCVEQKKVLTISTTTSLYDTGLLEEVIAPEFKKYSGIDVRFIAKGTGAAIQDAMRGAADVIFVHAPEKELEFMKAGYGVNRKVIAYNFFVIVGPPSDPAGIKGLSPIEAMKKIAKLGREGKIVWVSRGDMSGTNVKEIQLWKLAGFDYDKLKNEGWMHLTGSGMGKTLLYASNINAYTLSDTGTYLKYKKLIKLEELVSKGEELINIYSFIVVKNSKNFDAAMIMLRWLVSEDGQNLIAQFGKDEFGKSLFNPISKVDEKTREWIVKYGFFEDDGVKTECPKKFRLAANSLEFSEVKIQ